MILGEVRPSDFGQSKKRNEKLWETNMRVITIGKRPVPASQIAIIEPFQPGSIQWPAGVPLGYFLALNFCRFLGCDGGVIPARAEGGRVKSMTATDVGLHTQITNSKYDSISSISPFCGYVYFPMCRSKPSYS
jgi:hypothetical protein